MGKIVELSTRKCGALVWRWWQLRIIRDDDERFSEYLGRLVGFFMRIRCERLGAFWMEYVDDCEGEPEWVFWWVVSCCLIFWRCCWLCLKSSRSCSSWSSVMGLGIRVHYWLEGRDWGSAGVGEAGRGDYYRSWGSSSEKSWLQKICRTGFGIWMFIGYVNGGFFSVHVSMKNKLFMRNHRSALGWFRWKCRKTRAKYW